MQKRLIGALVAAALLAAFRPADAQVLGLHTASRHLPTYEWQNNDNPGLYLRTASGFTIGAYRNTINRPTVYLGRTYQDVLGPFDLTVAGATGYKVSVVSPLVVASVELAPRTWARVPRLSVARGPDSWVVHLSIEGKF